MSTFQPDAFATPAAQAPATERAKFLQRTYTWLLGGILAFCALVAAWPESEFLQSITSVFVRTPILGFVLLMATSYGARMLAEKDMPINVIGYALVVLMYGAIIAPLIYIVAPELVQTAALITGFIFVGLTAFVFMTGKDFSFMRGALVAGLFGLIGVGLAAMIFGFSVGIWFSYAGALLFSGFILYDTSQILHHYPTTKHIPAAINLFTSIIILFQYILTILASQDD